MTAVLPRLKPEYAEIVKAVELDERSIADVATENGLTTNNATVRLHRARAALRRRLVEVCGACSEHGCLDCTCRSEGQAI
jgi:RNA polymerase sigma-70 factor (ECF subfamily)